MPSIVVKQKQGLRELTRLYFPLEVPRLAMPREELNIYQADAIGCDIITATNDLLQKLALAGKDLAEYSLETVRMFYQDAKDAGYKL